MSARSPAVVARAVPRALFPTGLPPAAIGVFVTKLKLAMAVVFA